MSKVAVHPWSSEALFDKASLYIEQMHTTTAEDWQFGFWSTLGLELLARAALANVSPALLAEPKNWRNLTYALGGEPTSTKFTPSSIPTNEVFGRLTELLPTFTQEMAGFCSQHAERRNAEVHSGEIVFRSLGTSAWLPKFYLACAVLLEAMGRNLDDFFPDSETAKSMIESLEDAAAKAVNQDIKAHAQVWVNKSNEERDEASVRAKAWARKELGHRVTCPACESAALVQGDPSGTVTTDFEGDEVVQRQMMLPATFECIACGLRISGFSKLSACGLGDTYNATTTYTAAEYFGLYTEEELDNARNETMYEPDFNE